MKTALIFGATGLVGREVLNLLISDDFYSKIVVFNRKSQAYNSSKIEEVVSDLKNLDPFYSKLKGDVVFICTGSTIKKAGTKSNFEVVDLELPISLAMAAKENKIECVITISSLGANINSTNFYLKTKGDMEQSLNEIGVKYTYFVRPSMLFGKREEFRIGEYIGKVALSVFGFFLFGSMKKYRGIEGKQVAKAMIWISKNKPKPKQRVYESGELLEF